MQKNPNPKWFCAGCRAIIRESEGIPVVDTTEKMAITTMICTKCNDNKE